MRFQLFLSANKTCAQNHAPEMVNLMHMRKFLAHGEHNTHLSVSELRGHFLNLLAQWADRKKLNRKNKYEGNI